MAERRKFPSSLSLSSSSPWHICRLVAFARVVVPAHAEMQVTLPISADDLGFPGDDMIMRVHSGAYVLSAGFASNGDAGLTVQLNVSDGWDLQERVVRARRGGCLDVVSML